MILMRLHQGRVLLGSMDKQLLTLLWLGVFVHEFRNLDVLSQDVRILRG